MNFLAPAFLAGLAAIAVPVIIHLIHRERKVVIEFPSFMFLERIPYRSVRRQKIRHLLLSLRRDRDVGGGVRAAVLPTAATADQRHRSTRDRRAPRPFGQHGLRGPMDE